eukprot:gene18183-11985_t
MSLITHIFPLGCCQWAIASHKDLAQAPRVAPSAGQIAKDAQKAAADGAHHAWTEPAGNSAAGK